MRGVLTGKYAPDAEPLPDTRAGRKDRRVLQAEWRPQSLRLAQAIKQHAEARGMTAGQFAVLWVLNNALVTATIAGRAPRRSGTATPPCSIISSRRQTRR